MTTEQPKIDFKKTMDGYRARQGRFRIVEVPPLRYLMVDGSGDPNTAQEYADAVAALYPVAYGCKFASKRELGRDYVVPPLEALWWADTPEWFTTARDKSRWSWTVMIMVPGWMTEQTFRAAVEKVAAKERPTSLDRIRLERLHEGRCVQTLHVGPYDDEGPVLEVLHRDFIPDNGLTPRDKHHEIYLSDARRVEPSRLRTILRQPVDPA